MKSLKSTVVSAMLFLIPFNLCIAESPNQIRQRLHLAADAPIPQEELGKQNGGVQESAQQIRLEDCYSEGFIASACEQEITSLEQQYQLISAPDQAVQQLATGYHNMAYTSQGPAKEKWERKHKELFEFVFNSAKTVARLRLASTLADNGEQTERCMEKILKIDPDDINARQELMKYYENSNQWNKEIALLEAEYPNQDSAPDDILRKLATAYGQMISPVKGYREQKQLAIFHLLIQRAKSATQLYAACRVSADKDEYEACLKKTIALDPTMTKAKKDLMQYYISFSKWPSAFDLWRSHFWDQPFDINGPELADGLAFNGDMKDARLVVARMVSVAKTKDSAFSCEKLAMIHHFVNPTTLTPDMVSEIKTLRTHCGPSPWGD